MTIDFILTDFIQLFTSVSWLTISPWIECPAFIVGCLLQNPLHLHAALMSAWEGGRYILRDGKSLVVPLYRYLPLQAFVEDGITCFCQPVRVHALWWAGQDTSECVPERLGTLGERKMFKVRSARGWKGDWKLTPFGSGSLKKGFPFVPVFLIQIILHQNHRYISHFQNMFHIYYLPSYLQ